MPHIKAHDTALTPVRLKGKGRNPSSPADRGCRSGYKGAATPDTLQAGSTTMDPSLPGRPTMPDPAATSAVIPPSALADASLIIAAFRRRLREAGYPFAEPPGVSEILARIDAICFPTDIGKPRATPIPYKIPVL